MITTRTSTTAISVSCCASLGKTPRWGSAWKSFIKENADRSNVAYIQKTTLPYEDNSLDLDPTVKDALGQPVCRITADFKENEKKVGVLMQDKMERWFMEAGAIAVDKGPPGTMGPSTHAYGGTREWATTARLMWSIAGGFPTRCPILAFSGRR
jgi:hypothetical protein